MTTSVLPAGGRLALGGRRIERLHWAEYLIEAVGLGLFMVSACGFGVLLFHPASLAVRAVPDPMLRRALMGVAMGTTAAAIVYSPWGRRSGAHLNPALTLTFWRLGKVAPRDAVGYVLAQFAGSLLGVGVALLVLGRRLMAPAVHYVTTTPGALGLAPAFAAEVGISFLLMLTVLTVSNRPRIARYTGLCAGTLVALYITVEAPVSGMSMNPARTLASAVPSHTWMALWIYFLAPPTGMLLAAAAYTRRAARRVGCAKLCHVEGEPCIFCEYHRGTGQAQ